MNNVSASLRWARACFAVDVQGDQVVLVRAERRRGGLVFSTLSPTAPSFAEAVRKGTPCVACLSARESLTRRLEAPFSTVRKANKVFPTLLDIQLPFALEDCVYGFLPVAHGAGVTRALAVAARLDDVRKRVTALAALGIDAMALDHEGLALWTQSLREAPVGPGEEKILRILVNLRGEPSSLVLGRGEEFLAAHGIREGDFSQVRRLLRPHRTDTVQVRWLWVGPGAADARTVAALHAPFSSEWPGPSSVLPDPGTFLARALAERALLDGPLRCNLRSASLTHPSMLDRTRKQGVKAAVLFLVAGLLLCGCNGAARAMARQKEAAVDRAFYSLADGLAGSPVKAKGDAAIRIVGDKVRKKTEALKPFVNVLGPSLAATVASVADTAKRDSLRLDMLAVSRDRIQITGASRTWNGCDGLLSGLKRSGYSARLDRKDAGTDGIVPFSILSGSADER